MLQVMEVNIQSGVLGNTFDEKQYCYKQKLTCPVKSYKANDLGLYDMTGNVWEWCQDWYQKDFYKTKIDRNPVCKNDSSGNQVLRGGSWNINNDVWMRSTYRSYKLLAFRYDIYGFRCVMDIN